jgi:acetyl-CoA carboxylase biotin carboxyl carrier protein
MAPISWGPALRSIVARVEASDVLELEVRAEGLSIRLRRDSGSAAPAGTPDAGTAIETSGQHTIRCPLTGIWYDSPAPGAAPFVSVGDSLDVGTIIGLVETMKVFNEVAADAAGVVQHIFVRRGELVAEQSPLMTIEPSADDLTLPPGQLA